MLKQNSSVSFKSKSSQYGENKVLLMHNGKTGYVYDILGNLIEKGSDYTYNEVTQTSTVQPSTQDYRRYHYDLFGRMKEVWGVDPETQSLVLLAEYVYDFRGMRIAKIKDGHITRYHLDEEGRNLETETTDESVTTAWIGQKPLGYTDNEGTYWYISDHQGTTFMLTDGEGTILWEDAVNPFGITAGSRGSQDSQVLYTGKIFDADADLYYFNARWYDPETGRFASEDPARDGVNWYAYVGNNPLKYTDPMGLWRTREERKARRAERKSKRKERRNKRQNKKSSSNNNDSNKNSSNKGGSDNNSSNRNDSKGEESKGNTDPDQPDVGIDTGDNRELIDLPNVGSEDSKDAVMETPAGDVVDEDGYNVFATEEGVFLGEKWNKESDKEYGLGFFVRIKTNDGAIMNYGHLDPNPIPSPGITPGTIVKKGDYIGRIADPTNGNSTGPHVHVEKYIKTEDGSWDDVDPGKKNSLGDENAYESAGYPTYPGGGLHTGRDFAPKKDQIK